MFNNIIFLCHIMKKTLIALLISSNLSCADRMQFSGEVYFPRSSREEEITNLVGKVIGDIGTFKDESEEFK